MGRPIPPADERIILIIHGDQRILDVGEVKERDPQRWSTWKSAMENRILADLLAKGYRLYRLREDYSHVPVDLEQEIGPGVYEFKDHPDSRLEGLRIEAKNTILIHDKVRHEFVDIPPGHYKSWREALFDLDFQVENRLGLRAVFGKTGEAVDLDSCPKLGQYIVWEEAQTIT